MRVRRREGAGDCSVSREGDGTSEGHTQMVPGDGCGSG